MSELNVAFLWHMHQPNYRDPRGDGLALPWVRLHASRAYYDMAWLLERHPTIRATFNFVPVLTEQLQAYVDGARDSWFDLSRKPARELTTTERAFVTRHFFSCHPETCIRPRARYQALHGRVQGGETLSDDELRDLQVLFNLAWFGFAARVEFPFIDEMERKGRGFTEHEKWKVLDLQIAVVRRVLPMYRRLAERGQIELTTTPYYHPILPLVVDTEVAERCQPDKPRPGRFQWSQDAREHIQRAVRSHRRTFGAAPAGLWPAEGGVSPEALTLAAEEGVSWFATDEAQLWGVVPTRRPADLYRGYRLQLGDRSLDAVFRDRTLSDLIGFTYARNPPEVAVEDLVGRLHGIADLMDGRDDDSLVVIALDGENPWEYYPESGRSFLEALYAALENDERLLTVRIGPHLAEHPPSRALADIRSGSWIDGDFHIWIGGRIENMAWEALGRARDHYARHHGEVPADSAVRAYEHLLTAEGSDWFWWYGEPFSSIQDADFDLLFRGHLQQVYRELGATPPADLDRSLYPDGQAVESRPPRGLITPRFGDGDTIWFDWADAGVLELAGPISSMYQASHNYARLRYGFDLENLYLRLEPANDADPATLAEQTIRVRFHDGHPFTTDVRLASPEAAEVTQLKVRHGAVEMGLPFSAVAAKPGNRLRLTLHVLRNKVELDRYPSSGELEVVVPDATFEALHWRV